MRVTPKTEKEIYEADLLPDGWYPFTIAKAEEKLSKKGNEMIEANVKIYRGEGFSFVKDWLMDSEFGARKLRNLAVTCDLLAEYEAGKLNAEDLEAKEGYARIGREKSKDPQFADKNKIWDFAKEMPAAKADPKEEKKAAEHARIAQGKPRDPDLDPASSDDIPW